MHEEGDHATKNQLSGSLLQGDGLEKRLEQWECILHDQHGRLLLQGLANGPLHHHLAQIRRKEEAPPLSPHTSKKRNFKTRKLGPLGLFIGWALLVESVPEAGVHGEFQFEQSANRLSFARREGDDAFSEERLR